MPRLTDDQLAERAKGLGATDVAVAAGLDPYTSPFELYLIKTGQLDPEASIDEASRGRMERGHRMEDVALEWDRDINGEAFERVSRTVWHPTIPFIYCHPDARRKPWRQTRRLIEVKTSARAWKEIPRKTEAQVQVQMACTGAQDCDVLVLGFDGPPVRWRVERDDALIEALEGVATSMWERIERRDPPPMDGSAGAGRWLDHTRWKDEPEISADPDQREVLRQLLDIRQRSDALAREDDRLVNILKFTMAGSGRLSARGIGNVIWTAPTIVHGTKWKEVAQTFKIELDMLASAGLTSLDTRAVQAEYTSEREARSFLVRDERED